MVAAADTKGSFWTNCTSKKKKCKDDSLKLWKVLMYRSLVQRGPLVVQKVSEQLRSVAAGTQLHIRRSTAQLEQTQTRRGEGDVGGVGGVSMDKHNGMTSPGEGSLPQSTVMYKGQRSKLDSCVTSQAERVESEAPCGHWWHVSESDMLAWGGTPE